MHRKRWYILVVAVAASLAVVAPPSAADHVGGHGVPGGGDDDFLDEDHQHGPSSGHLAASSENVDLVGKLRLARFEGDISDVSALQTSDGRWFAYVGDWGAKCETGGVHVVDITDPAVPVRAGFLTSPGFGYVTEGVHALHIDTTGFEGDILVISNEWCRVSGNPKNMPGGITIWDVTEPTEPKKLVEAFGDFDDRPSRAKESHSAIAWDAGDDAYVAAIDNEELEDVDIFQITDPRNPVKVSETGLVRPGPEGTVVVNWPAAGSEGYGQLATSHDFDVLQKPDGTWHLMVSYWDTGWVDLDVTDPANPTFVEDFDYDCTAEVVPSACPPEGNGHQGEWNADGSLFLGTDEDQSPFRTPVEVLDGTLAGQKIDAGEFGFTKLVADFPGGEVNGPTVFGGYGCPDDTAEVPDPSVLGPLGPDEEAIIVFQRGPVGDPNHDHGACFFSDKIRLGEEKGYDVVVVANHHQGTLGGILPDAFACGGQGSPVLGTAAGLCIGHRFMHEAFGKAPDYTFPYPSPAPLEPSPGELGPRIRATSEFDGWGYVRLLDADPAGGFTQIDTLAIDELSDPNFASGFGDLSVHEVEVPRGDPNEGGENSDDGTLAYFSWYAGGFRVAEYDATGIEEVGHFIDDGGNNFWGVALAEDQNGDRIVLASDRDFGLYIFRYTAP
jgi:hypothetical protein